MPALIEKVGFPSAPSGAYLPALGSMPTASGVLVSQATSLQVAAVYACCRIRARDLARCTPQILKNDGKGNKSEVSDHPLAALFSKPNRVQPWFNFAEQMHVALMLRSNAYAVVLRDWRGRPTELIPLNPDLVTPMESPDGSLFYNVSRAGLWLMAVLADEPIVIPAEDVLHIRDLAFNTLVGVSRIALARDAIGLAMVQEQQAGRWAGNGARPAGVLQSDKTISTEAASRLRQQWDQLQSGLQNTGRTAILEDGLKWQQMALSSVDLEFGAARLYQVKEVARFFEVPLHKLGENESLPRASIAELNADYVQNTVMGDATRWEQAVAQHFGIDGDLEVKLDEKALLRADLATMTNAARTGVMSGLITQNEGRAIIGYGPMDGADKLLAPVNLAPNGSAADGVAPDDAGRPPSGLNPGDMKRLSDAHLSDADVTRIAGAVVKEMRKGFDPDQPRDADGEWTGDGEDGAVGGETYGSSYAALSHEAQLAVKATAVVAAAAIAPLVLPEAVAGSFLVTGALAAAEGIAFDMYVRAGIEAGKHALNDMGVSTAKAEALLREVRDIAKAAPDAHDVKLLARLAPVLAASAPLARDTVVAELKTEKPQTPQELVDTIDEARDAYVAKLGGLDAAGGKALKTFDPNQPRDELGRWASDSVADVGPYDLQHHFETVGGGDVKAALDGFVPKGVQDALEALVRPVWKKSGLLDVLSRDEAMLVAAYSKGSDWRVNNALRSGDPGDAAASFAGALNATLLKMRQNGLGWDDEVKRGITFKTDDQRKAFLATYVPGATVQWNGFGSTTSSAMISKIFASTNGATITIFPQKYGVNIKDGSAFPDEDEILFRAGTILSIKDVNIRPDGHVDVQASEFLGHDYSLYGRNPGDQSTKVQRDEPAVPPDGGARLREHMQIDCDGPLFGKGSNGVVAGD